MMKFLILASIIVFSMIGIAGVQSVDSRCLGPCSPHPHLTVKDTLGNAIGTANLNQQYTLSWNVDNILMKFIPCQETTVVNFTSIQKFNGTFNYVPIEKCVFGNKWIPDDRINNDPPSPVIVLLQVTDEKNSVEYLAWIEASVPPNDSKTFDFSWTPIKIGQHTLTVFTWESLENPVALKPPTSTFVQVIET